MKKHAQFVKVYKKGRSFKEGNIVLCLLPNGTAENKVGLSVSAKKTPLAVHRNRSKRLLLESHRAMEGNISNGYDIVFIAHKDLHSFRMDQVKERMLTLYQKSGILEGAR